jgi:hypothetical protein
MLVALIEGLVDPRNRVRWEAAKALGEPCDAGAAPALVQALEDRNSGVRWIAAGAMIGLRQRGLTLLLKELRWRIMVVRSCRFRTCVSPFRARSGASARRARTCHLCDRADRWAGAVSSAGRAPEPRSRNEGDPTGSFRGSARRPTSRLDGQPNVLWAAHIPRQGDENIIRHWVGTRKLVPFQLSNR